MSKDNVDFAGAKILVVDDQTADVKLLCDLLEPQGIDVLSAKSGDVALQLARRTTPDLILLDVFMPPGLDGFETCLRLKADSSTQKIPVIFITGNNTETSEIVEGFRVGAVDYIIKPYAKEELLCRVETHLTVNRLTRELSEKNSNLEQQTAQLKAMNQRLRLEITRREQAEDERDQAVEDLEKVDRKLSVISEQEAARWGIKGFVSASPTIAEILDNVRRLHEVNTSVLITGESGTGKEMIARAIHFGGPRAKSPFIAVNCSAIPENLAESEFFGHVKGAFTGANTDRKGHFELADGGTLFLDEIGEMPFQLQSKLLRVLQEGVITPVGAGGEKHVDVRIIAATNADLQVKIDEGTFRQDIYFRIARFPIEVPPLRLRKEDIPLLADYFIKMFSKEIGMEKAELSQEALVALVGYDFPGNIRELKNIIELALIKCKGTIIKPEHLGLDANTRANQLPQNNKELKKAKAEARQKAEESIEREALIAWLAENDGNITRTAEKIGMNRSQLSQLISKHQLKKRLWSLMAG